MSINLRTGQPGHGKSYSAIVEIYEALQRGQWVVTNVPLTDGWASTMARANIFRRLRGRRFLEQTAARYQSRMYFVEDLTELRRIRLPPCGKCKGCVKGPGCQKEGRGKALLDEAHQWLNARTWDADETGSVDSKTQKAMTKAEAIRRRLDIVRFFATHRHRGWDVELLTQDEANLDTQVRRLYETHTHLKNMRRFKLGGVLPIVPFNLFIAVTTWHDVDKTRLGVKMYPLNKKLARCYDTFGAGRFDDEDGDAIYLGNLLVDDELGRLSLEHTQLADQAIADAGLLALPELVAANGRTDGPGVAEAVRTGAATTPREHQ